MKFVDDQNHYLELREYYLNLDAAERRVERMHYRYQIETYPVVGLYITLIAMLVSNGLIDSLEGKIITLIILVGIVLLVARYIIREASVHVSVIDDTETLLKNNNGISKS